MLKATDCLEIDLDRAAGDVIDGEAIIINLVSGAYYSMLGIGGQVWSMIGARRSIESMVDEIVATYDVAREDAHRDLALVLDQLLEEDLVHISSEPAAGATVMPRAEELAYVPPQLHVYRDMQDLLALDPPAPGMKNIVWRDHEK
jgi:hypothetical protein